MADGFFQGLATDIFLPDSNSYLTGSDPAWTVNPAIASMEHNTPDKFDYYYQARNRAINAAREQEKQAIADWSGPGALTDASASGHPSTHAIGGGILQSVKNTVSSGLASVNGFTANAAIIVVAIILLGIAAVSLLVPAAERGVGIAGKIAELAG